MASSQHITHLSLIQKKLRRRILEISHASGLSHIGSCVTAVDFIYLVYYNKKRSDRFVLSNGHAGVALYTVLEEFGHLPNKKLVSTFSIHPDRNIRYDIHVSTGSLGQGLPIAVGMSIGDVRNNIYCMISDGEASEGSIWEALRIARQAQCANLRILVNANGWGAYSRISTKLLQKQLRGFGWKLLVTKTTDIKKLQVIFKKFMKQSFTILFAQTKSDSLSFLKGQDAHYHVMTEEEYRQTMEDLK